MSQVDTRTSADATRTRAVELVDCDVHAQATEFSRLRPVRRTRIAPTVVAVSSCAGSDTPVRTRCWSTYVRARLGWSRAQSSRPGPRGRLELGPGQ
jgi:hypothetical protein